MKTLGDTGSLPDSYCIRSKVTGVSLPEPNSRDIQYQYGHNAAIDQLSALPLITVVKKALALGLIVITMSTNDDWG